MRAASGRAWSAPGAIAQMMRRVDIAKKTLVVGRARVAETGKPRVNLGHADALYVADAVTRPQGRSDESDAL